MPGTNEGNKERKTSIFSYINYPQLFSSFYFYFPLDPRYTITPWPTPWNGPVTEDACTRPANTRGGEVLEGWQRIGGKFAPYNGISRCISFAGDKVLGYSGRARSPPQLISSFFQSFISFTDRPRGGTLVKYWYPSSGFLGRVNIVSQPTRVGNSRRRENSESCSFRACVHRSNSSTNINPLRSNRHSTRRDELERWPSLRIDAAIFTFVRFFWNKFAPRIDR